MFGVILGVLGFAFKPGVGSSRDGPGLPGPALVEADALKLAFKLLEGEGEDDSVGEIELGYLLETGVKDGGEEVEDGG